MARRYKGAQKLSFSGFRHYMLKLNLLFAMTIVRDDDEYVIVGSEQFASVL